MRPADGSTALLDPPARVAHDVPRDGTAMAEVAAAPAAATYHVLLLAGEPRHHTCSLPAGIEAGTDIEVAGSRWTVADVRAGREGASATLVCIYAE